MKITRPKLISEITRMLGIPNGKKSLGYMTKKQLLELFFKLKESENSQADKAAQDESNNCGA